MLFQPHLGLLQELCTSCLPGHYNHGVPPADRRELEGYHKDHEGCLPIITEALLQRRRVSKQSFKKVKNKTKTSNTLVIGGVLEWGIGQGIGFKNLVLQEPICKRGIIIIDHQKIPSSVCKHFLDKEQTTLISQTRSFSGNNSLRIMHLYNKEKLLIYHQI